MIFLDCFKFLWREHKEDDSEELNAIKEDIQQYRDKIAAFDDYVKSRPDLTAVVDDLKNRLFGTLAELEEPERTKAAFVQAKIDYKLHWQMRRLFIKIEPKLAECKVLLGRKRKAAILEKLKTLENPSTELTALFQQGSYAILSRRLKRMSLKLHPDKAKNVDPYLFTKVLTPVREELKKILGLCSSCKPVTEETKSSALAVLANPLPRKLKSQVPKIRTRETFESL